MCRNHENNSVMAHGLHAMIKSEFGCSGSSSGKPRMDHQTGRPGGGSSGAAGKMGSRRIFTPQFKLQVLDSYRNDSDCKGNQRATARKYGIHRRQIQKWLQVENNLRSAAANSNGGGGTGSAAMKINLLSNSASSNHHHHPQFQLHQHHHHHMQHHHHRQNLNSIELKVTMDSTRHRVAQNASSNNNNNTSSFINGKESSGACIISPVATHTVPPSSQFSHPHESSPSSACLSVLSAAHSKLAASQVPRPPSFSPAPADRLHLLDQYYHYQYAAKYGIDCPIDLSIPPAPPLRAKVEQALSPCSTVSSVYSSRPRSPTPATLELKHEDSEKSPDSDTAVDLSCRKRKSSEDSCYDGSSPPKSVKLFKPYLLDEKDDDKDSSIDSPLAEPLPPKPLGRLDYPIIWNFHAQRYYESMYSADYGSGPYVYPPSPPYPTQQPLTPIPRTPFSGTTTLSPSPPTTSWAPPQASPVSGYDSSTSISSVYSQDGNDDATSGYSLELRQQAIVSYYHDASCRGDYRAVASKYNIQRKYVEKWLAQEDHPSQSAAAPQPLPQVVVG